MKELEQELRELGLKIYPSEAPDRLPIDFSIADSEDNVCWVWGEKGSYEIECNHIVGEVCPLCGAESHYHYEKGWCDDGHDDDGNCIGHETREMVVDSWGRSRGGIIKRIVEKI